MLSRIITSLYNEPFEPEGVTFAQASLLMHVFAQPGIRQVALSRMLQIEKSALSRDIQLLQRKGWIAAVNRHGLHLTDEGIQIARRCHKIWKRLHGQIQEELGQEAISALSVFSGQLFRLQEGRKQAVSEPSDTTS